MVSDSVPENRGVVYTVAEAPPGAQDRWDRFADAQPAASFCHLFAWRRVMADSYGLQTPFLMAEAPDARVGGILPLVVVPNLWGPPTLVSMPFLDQGGIVAESEAAFAALRDEALRLAASLRTRGLELRGAAASPPPRDRFLAVLPLPANRSELWKTIGPKVRNLVRKAERLAVTCQRAAASELSTFYDVFARNMWAMGSPVHARAFFERILDSLSDRCTLYLVRSAGGDPIAGGLAIRFRDTVTVPWASALPAALSLCPNYCLYWTALTDAVEAGARAFDFGRSSLGSGTLHFKKQWGAELRPLTWSHLDLDGSEGTPQLLDPRRNRWLAQGWARLPLFVANQLGPRIRRRLSN